MRPSTLCSSAWCILVLLLALCSAATGASASSLSGRVASLNGEGERGVLVRAVRLTTEQVDASTLHAAAAEEEVSTDASGAYTFSKLADGQRYAIAVRTAAANTPAASTEGENAAVPASSRLVRASPEYYRVHAGASSTTPLDFVAFRRPATQLLSGEIVGLSAAAGLRHLNTLEVSVAAASAPQTVLAKTALLAPTVPYFEFTLPAGERYIVSVRTSLSARTYSFSAPPVSVVLQSEPVHVKVVVSISFNASSVAAMQGSSLWNGLLIVSALVALLYRERTVQLLQAFGKALQSGNIAPVTQQISSWLPASSSSAQAAAASFAAPASDDSSSGKGKRKEKYPAKKEKTHVSTFVRYDSLPGAQTVTAAPVVTTPVAAPEKVSFVPRSHERSVRATVSLPVSQPKAAPAPVARVQAPVATPSPVARSASPVAATPSPPLPSPPPAQVDRVLATLKQPAEPKKAKAAPAVAAVPAKAAPASAPVAATVAAAAAPMSGPKFCAECGHKRTDGGGKFCSECGHRF